MPETISINVYPWAAPTAEQRAAFDALPVAERCVALAAAIDEGFASPLSDKSVQDLILAARAEAEDAA